MPAPFAADPVFHRPPEALRAKLAVALKQLDLQRPGSAAARAAAQQVRTLIRGKEGPALARMALLHPGNRGRVAALRAARRLVAAHPRLASFAVNDLTAKEPERARAAVAVALGSGCDTPAVYAMDGLQHADASVREATIVGALVAADRSADRGLLAIISTHIRGEKSPRLRALFARAVGQLGLVTGFEAVEALLKDPAAVVRGEAAVAIARMTGGAPGNLKRLLTDRSPATAMALVRVYAALDLGGDDGRDSPLGRAVRRLLRDRRVARDPLAQGPAVRLDRAAAEALAWQGQAPSSP